VALALEGYVVAAAAEELGFTHWRGVACNAFGQQAERTLNPQRRRPAKELQAAPLQVPAGYAVAATTACPTKQGGNRGEVGSVALQQSVARRRSVLAPQMITKSTPVSSRISSSWSGRLKSRTDFLPGRPSTQCVMPYSLANETNAWATFSCLSEMTSPPIF